MDTTLTEETVLNMTSWCVIRKQKEQYLVYNSRTDEMHLITPTGYCVFQLCDGLNTVGEIQRLMTEAIGEDEESVRTCTEDFLSGLIVRGILEVDNG